MILRTYIDAWRDAMDAVIDLNMHDEDADRVTDLPGWSVRDVVAHLIHLEELLADGAESSAADGPANPPPAYTQDGVDALAGVPFGELLARLCTAVERRAAQLTVLPQDPTAMAPSTPAGASWSWETLLRNRAVDAWMHEQDLRRAINRGGNLDSPGARITVEAFAAALPIVIGKRAAAPAGHAVRVEVTGPVAFTRTLVVGDDGRAVDTDDEPATTLTMDTEAFIVLGGGRRKPGQVPVVVSGDHELAHYILSNLAVTP